MFDHPDIQKYAFEEVPLDEDLYLMDEKWLPEYEAMLTGFLRGQRSSEPVGYISYAAARRVIGDHAIDLSWYPRTSTHASTRCVSCFPAISSCVALEVGSAMRSRISLCDARG